MQHSMVPEGRRTESGTRWWFLRSARCSWEGKADSWSDLQKTDSWCATWGLNGGEEGRAGRADWSRDGFWEEGWCVFSREVGGHWQCDYHLETLDKDRPRRMTHDKKHVNFMAMVPSTQDTLKSKHFYVCWFILLNKGIISKQKHQCDLFLQIHMKMLKAGFVWNCLQGPHYAAGRQ